MLKVAITVNPNKDHDLVYTSRLLDILEECGCRVFMSDTFKKPYGNMPSVSESLLAGRKIEYLPEYQLFRRVGLCIVFGGDGTILKIAKKPLSAVHTYSASISEESAILQSLKRTNLI